MNKKIRIVVNGKVKEVTNKGLRKKLKLSSLSRKERIKIDKLIPQD